MKVCYYCGIVQDAINIEHLCIESPNLGKGPWQSTVHQWVGAMLSEEEPPRCSYCHDYPCVCTAGDIMLAEDLQAEVRARESRGVK